MRSTGAMSARKPSNSSARCSWWIARSALQSKSCSSTPGSTRRPRTPSSLASSPSSSLSSRAAASRLVSTLSSPRTVWLSSFAARATSARRQPPRIRSRTRAKGRRTATTKKRALQLPRLLPTRSLPRWSRPPLRLQRPPPPQPPQKRLKTCRSNPSEQARTSWRFDSVCFPDLGPASVDGMWRSDACQSLCVRLFLANPSPLTIFGYICIHTS
mmetsp:Transcript_10575/g.29871  ORF Transcript_10575/g.29871 Transcript_10575/m.29871 type:complete len:214 (-) Transcript_10575:11-652(-)